MMRFLMARDLGGVGVGTHNLAAAAISRKARQELAIGGGRYMRNLEDWLATNVCKIDVVISAVRIVSEV